MPNTDAPLAPDPLQPPDRPGRRRHLWRRVSARRGTDENDSAFGFGVRLFAAIALTLALVCAVGYVLIDRQLEHRQIENDAAAQRADARGFEYESAHASSPARAIGQIDGLLDAIQRRPGTLEALLIDRRHVIRASGEDRLIGAEDNDARIEAALRDGRSYAGREGDPRKDRANFEFVTPVELAGERYAYELSYSHRAYDAQLHDIRLVLGLVGLIALFGGGAVFYLIGGRTLLRDHRLALARATRDGLTDIPNQRAFQDELPQAVASAGRYLQPVALAVLDVDDFKFINDRHGHPHGDAVLRRVAAVLRESRPSDRSFRVGGDEFALLLAQTDAEGARMLARRLSRNLADAGIAASVGVSSLRPGERADTLREEADAALYESKRQGGGRATHYNEIRERVAVTSADKKEAVRRLIDEGRLSTVFQPIWNFEAETLLGVEALTRPDPEYGLSGPAEAFDVAEQLGLVHRLDVLCVRSALRSVPELAPGALLFVNLAPQTLDLDAERDDWFRRAVEQAGLPRERVVIEVTERFGGRTAAVVKCLARLRGQGFQTALDDVGTGNSGLEMLRRIDAEFVKLDRSIVVAAPTQPGARAVLMAMATFARQTGAFVIAEGIEDQDTLAFLRGIAAEDLQTGTVIQGGQGFELGRPAPAIAGAGAGVPTLSGPHGGVPSLAR